MRCPSEVHLEVYVKYLGKAWLIIFLMASLTGCTWLQQIGSDAPTVQPTSTVDLSPTPFQEVTPTRAFPPAPGRMTLKLWLPEFLDPYNETAGGSALTTQLNAFSTQNEKVQVEVIAKNDTGPGGLLSLLTTAVDVAPAILPDVIVLNTADVQIAANAGFIQPVNEVSVSWSDFYPFAVEGLDVDNNEVYGLPFIADADHMAYRIGVADSPPLSWTSVVTYGYTMLFPAGSPDALADDALLAAYIGSGGSVIDEEGMAMLDRLYLEQVYAFFFDMTRQGLINTERALSLPDADAAWTLYQEGVGALSPVPVGLYWQNPAQGSRPVWMPNAQEKPTAIVRNWSLAVVTTDPNRQIAASKLISWLVDPRHMSELSRSALLLPTRRHAVRLWGLFPEDQMFLHVLLENGIPSLPPEVDTPVRRALQFGLVAVLRQDVLSPEEAATFAMTNLRR